MFYLLSRTCLNHFQIAVILQVLVIRKLQDFMLTFGRGIILMIMQYLRLLLVLVKKDGLLLFMMKIRYITNILGLSKIWDNGMVMLAIIAIAHIKID